MDFPMVFMNYYDINAVCNNSSNIFLPKFDVIYAFRLLSIDGGVFFRCNIFFLSVLTATSLLKRKCAFNLYANVTFG